MTTNNTVNIRMKALLDLNIPSLIKIDDQTAVMRINSEWEVKVTILEKSIIYEAMNKGKSYNPKKDPGVPQDVIGVIDALDEKFKAALIELMDGGEDCSASEGKREEPVKDPIENLKDGGFDISDVPDEATEEHVNRSEGVSEEERNLINREENKRKLAMAEEAKEAEDALKQQHNATSKHGTSTHMSETDEIFTDRPVEYIDAPLPKNGEVNLFDALSKICKNDLMQIFGNTGTGKTSICTKLALDSKLRGMSVLYIDTEHNINDDQIEAMRKAGIKYEYIKKFPKLCEEVKRLPKYGVVIIDSAGAPALAAYCRSELRGQGDILKKLIAMSDDLKNYATDNNSLVVVINQPESSMNKGDAILEPFGEKSRYYYKEILKTNYAKNGRTTGKTTLVLRAHRSRCMGIDTNICTMEVTDNGMKVIQ